MKNPIRWSFIKAFLLAVLSSWCAVAADSAKITVLNPRGIQPPIRLIPMAPRLQSLDGKTIYVVDTNFPLTEPFVQEIPKVMAAHYPKTTWIYRKKVGSYFDDDPNLWQEIKEKGHGMIIAVGH
jgi:hypothetical protein